MDWVEFLEVKNGVYETEAQGLLSRNSLENRFLANDLQEFSCE